MVAMVPSHSFALSGGALCLDYANTWEDRGRPETDHLAGYSDLLDFCRQAGIVGERESAALAERAAAIPVDAVAALTTCRELREGLYRILAAVAAGGVPSPGDLAILNTILPRAFETLRLEARDGTFEWAWPPGSALDSPLGPILFDAAELLTSRERGRIRECASDACTWLFLDGSRNGSRRWCSMETCGNRAKAKRHYRRRRTVEPAT